ncbi:hypothetical protein BDN72DRAFT_876813 [Pluteus cervinus]|uniref:Uncharacterized protein n=1 Tax=Pluteus cervinus TaxID=181527 RepID=A0ACD3B123_9AGAR|nr:hypothetical protein BDN72DRAFT_876813 [Pluteus cervinus]
MTTTQTIDERELEKRNRLLSKRLREFETFCPRPLGKPHVDEEIPPSALFNFYDRHVAEHLRLKHVHLQSSLHEDLARRVDSKLDELQDVGLGVPRPSNELKLLHPWSASSNLPSGAIHPKHISRWYWDIIGKVASPIASHFIISPHAPFWLLNATFFRMDIDQDNQNDAKNYPWQGFAFQLQQSGVLEKERKLLSWLDEPTTEFLKARAGEDIINFIFLPYSQQSADVMREMDRFALQRLPSSCCATTGYSGTKPSDAETTRVDALKTPWLVREPPHDANSQLTAQSEESSEPKPDKVLSPSGGRPTDFGKDGAATAEGLIHHIWRTAVASDSTFVVISCGDVERIGVRHRGTQTLYLSKLIEVFESQDPAYPKIHLGLHIAALEDAQDRYRQSQGSDISNSGRTQRPNLRKRKRENEEPDVFSVGERRGSKRAWLKSASRNLSELMDHSRPETEEFWRQLDNRSLALIFVQGDSLNSPIPASCLRIGGTLSPHGLGPLSKKWNKSYKPINSLKVTLQRPLYRGSGRIHPAIIEIKLADGQTLTQKVMAKVAMTPADRGRLKHEYSIYKHLWEQEVEGISCVFGLFEDFDNLATIMIMERGGLSLLARKPVGAVDNAVELDRKEKKACLSILTAVHQAGVLHGYIHPKHITTSHDFKTTIIDFSQAKLDASEQELKTEITFILQRVYTLLNADLSSLDILLILPLMEPGATPTCTLNVSLFHKLGEALQQSLPEMTLDPNGSPNTSTRPPAYYDAHLAPELVLRRITSLPTLASDLKRCVENNTLRVCSQRLVSDDEEDAIENLSLPGSLPSLVYKTEKNIVDYFDRYVAPITCSLAILFLFREEFLESRATKKLYYETTANERNKAIADAFLRLRQLPGDEELVAGNTLVIWENKTPEAGSLGVRNALKKLINEGTFGWFRCSGELDEACSKQKGHSDSYGNIIYTRARRSPDSTRFGNTLPEAPSEQTVRTDKLRRGERGTGITHREHAQYIIQQVEILSPIRAFPAWAEAVKNDTTFLVIQMGNHEYIGLRHRESQELFLSEEICVQSPGYIQLHVGLYMRALFDAELRSARLARAFKNRGLKGIYATIRRNWFIPTPGLRSKEPTVEEGKALTNPGQALHNALRIHRIKGRNIPEVTFQRYEFGDSKMAKREPLPYHINLHIISGSAEYHGIYPYFTALANVFIDRWESPLQVALLLGFGLTEQMQKRYTAYCQLMRAERPQNARNLDPGLLEHFGVFAQLGDTSMISALITAVPGRCVSTHAPAEIPKILSQFRPQLENILNNIHWLDFALGKIKLKNIYVTAERPYFVSYHKATSMKTMRGGKGKLIESEKNQLAQIFDPQDVAVAEPQTILEEPQTRLQPGQRIPRAEVVARIAHDTRGTPSSNANTVRLGKRRYITKEEEIINRFEELDEGGQPRASSSHRKLEDP